MRSSETTVQKQSPQGGRRIRTQSEIATAAQAWDQISLKRYGSEKQMGPLLPANAAELDALLLSGGLEIAIPEVEPLAVKSCRPGSGSDAQGKG